MAVEAPSGVRNGRVSDFRALSTLYSTRGEDDRKRFHPFPGGRFTAPVAFLVLLTVQRLRRCLVLVHPPWGFAFVVHPADTRGTIDGFAYFRIRRRTRRGFVGNIGTFVGASGRGRGMGPALLSVLFAEARKDGVCEIETWAYRSNVAARRMGARLGLRSPGRPPDGSDDGSDESRVAGVLDLGAAGSGGRRGMPSGPIGEREASDG